MINRRHTNKTRVRRDIRKVIDDCVYVKEIVEKTGYTEGVINRALTTHHRQILIANGNKRLKSRVSKKTPPKILEREKKKRMIIKNLIFEHYGAECACCGESILEFLTIDHIDNDGAKHRKKIGGGGAIYRWLYKQYIETGEWPKGFQTLCRNCNWGKHINNGVCPHKNKVKWDSFSNYESF